MKPTSFKYVKPDSMEAALECLRIHGDEAKVLAGGQSLLPMMNFRLARPRVLVDLSAVPGLSEISDANGAIRIGSMVRQRTAEVSDKVRRSCPLLIDALRHVGHVQIRNRGTVGGSLAHADPAAELPAVAVALDAKVVVASRERERSIPASEFFVGPLTTVLEPDELVVSVEFRDCKGMRSGFLEIARRGGDFAIAGVGVSALFVVEEGKLSRVGMAAIGVGGTPVRLTGVERLLEEGPVNDELISEAAYAAEQAVDPPSDVHADSTSRRQLLSALVDRVIRRSVS